MTLLEVVALLVGLSFSLSLSVATSVVRKNLKIDD